MGCSRSRLALSISGDDADLAEAQIALGQRGHVVFQAPAQGVGLGQPLFKRFGLEEMEYFAGARRGVAAVGDVDDLAGGLEQKRQRRFVFAPFERGVGVALGLPLVGGDVGAFFVALGLDDDADGDAIDEPHIVSRAGVGRVVTHRGCRGPRQHTPQRIAGVRSQADHHLWRGRRNDVSASVAAA